MEKELSHRQILMAYMPYPVLKTLIKYDVLDKFVSNCLIYLKDNSIYNLIEASCHYENKFIALSFIWKNTPEGYSFWKNISDKVDE